MCCDLSTKRSAGGLSVAREIGEEMISRKTVEVGDEAVWGTSGKDEPFLVDCRPWMCGKADETHSHGTS